MSTALENLNLEEGKSDTLRAVFAGIAEATSADGGPRYSAKVSRELARIIVCRSYAKPLLELSHLLVAASAGPSRYEDLFWGMPRASAGDFRRAFMALDNRNADVWISDNGVRYEDGNGGFQISYGRMPLLAALLEFMVMTVGYPELEGMTDTLRQRDVDSEAVLDAARALQRGLYSYLKAHLPAVQRQRRERHFLTYTDAHAGNRTGTEAINDDVVLGYWQTYADSDEIDAKTFRAVYDTARKLISALDAAQERLSGAYAKSIGTDVEAGEVDPADMERVVGALDEDDGPLLRLIEICDENVKFVNVNEAETLSDLPLGDATARRIPVSVLRNAVFGAVQLRISTALRRGNIPRSGLLPDGQGYYLERLQAYADIIAGTERLALAALWALHQSARIEAVELALALAPDINWGHLTPPQTEAGGEDVVDLAAMAAARQFFALSADAKGDEIPALLSDARRAWRSVNRTGFRDEADEETLDIMAAGVPEVLRLIQSVHRILGRELGMVDWTAFETSDIGTFAAMFDKLYDLGEEADSHAC
ncbi:hypothetical protein L2D14_06720 [Thalassospiraceae bacterium LMO-JJ14]|nr:hypothetical protein L2D14_06720 [Thalassospiraceae bacterium LMO-JJ14]